MDGAHLSRPRTPGHAHVARRRALPVAALARVPDDRAAEHACPPRRRARTAAALCAPPAARHAAGDRGHAQLQPALPRVLHERRDGRGRPHAGRRSPTCTTSSRTRWAPTAPCRSRAASPRAARTCPRSSAWAASKGFWGIEVNTNGLVIAARDGYLEELVWAGLTGVYLSFDGLDGRGVRGHVRARHPGREDARHRALPRGGHPGGAVRGRGGGPERRAAGRPSALLPGQRRRGGGARPAAGVHVGPLRRRARLAHELGRRDLPAGRAVGRAPRAARRVAARGARTRCATRACSS